MTFKEKITFGISGIAVGISFVMFLNQWSWFQELEGSGLVWILSGTLLLAVAGFFSSNDSLS